jgi:hypothetical protein
LTGQGVEVGNVLFDELVLEGDVEVKLKTFLGPGRERSFVGVLVVREFENLMSTREFEKRSEGTDELKAALMNIFGINGLIDLAIEDTVLGRLNGPEAHGHQNDRYHRQHSCACTAKLGFGVCVVEAVFHIGWLPIY